MSPYENILLPDSLKTGVVLIGTGKSINSRPTVELLYRHVPNDENVCAKEQQKIKIEAAIESIREILSEIGIMEAL